MPENFRDLFTGNLPQGFFDNGQLPDVPFYGDTQGASNKDLIGGALNAGGMFVPGLNVASGLYNFGTNVQPGFDKGQFGNIDTNYQMGGGDSPNFQAPQPSTHDSIMGSQRAGNALYGGGLIGWLGDLLGQAAGGISTWGGDKIDATPNYQPNANGYQPMDQSEASSLMQSVMDSLNGMDNQQPYQIGLRNEPTYAPMSINPGPMPDYGLPVVGGMDNGRSQSVQGQQNGILDLQSGKYTGNPFHFDNTQMGWNGPALQNLGGADAYTQIGGTPFAAFGSPDNGGQGTGPSVDDVNRWNALNNTGNRWDN